MGVSKKYSDEELLTILKDYDDKNGKSSISTFSAKNGLPHYSVYIKRFGSWNDAKTLAGITKINPSTYEINKDELVNSFKELIEKLGYIPSSIEFGQHFSIGVLYRLFNTYNEFVNYCGFEYNKIKNGKYDEQFLISEIKRFVKEFDYIPTPRDFEKREGYPSRKTFTNHFGNFKDALIKAGFQPEYKTPKPIDKLSALEYNKDYLLKLIQKYIDEIKEVPTLRNINSWYGKEIKFYFTKYFGGWNNALKEAGLPLNSVSQYEDDFLESEFHRFVKENGRVPAYDEFNNSEYPSFWCYQNRFGSWNKAVIAYGYETNNKFYELEDGEICLSKYEFDVSNWLKSKNINYDRDVLYKSFIDNYKGKMNCDYVINYDGIVWYIEVAGYFSDRKKASESERLYYFKLIYKEKLLKRQGVNYLIIKPKDFKKKTLEEIFSPMMGGVSNWQMNLNAVSV